MRFLSRWLGALLVLALCSTEANAAVQRKKFSTPSGYLIIEVLDDDLLHVEVSAVGSGPSDTAPLYTSPMVHEAGYTGASSFADAGSVLETADLLVEVNTATLEVRVLDKTQGNAELTRIRPKDLTGGLKRLEIEPGSMRNVYGLGQQLAGLPTPAGGGRADGDWVAHGRRRGVGLVGNGFEGFEGGAVGNVQIPVMYAVAAGTLCYALFLDNVYAETWQFDQSPWQVSTFGDQLRFYVMAGPSLLDLRKDYLELTGMPPVPPRKAFGLWVSEFGYDNWEQVKGLRDGLRQGGFPVDGFVLDLNWFGGIVPNQPCCSQMGRLDWDQTATDGNPYYFPQPGTELSAFAAEHIGIAAIEESYVAEQTLTHAQMPAKLMVYERTNGQCDPSDQSRAVRLTEADFWGNGRMIDWSDPAAAAFIHDQRRYPNLVDKGISVHWTDLGEPERFDPAGCYEGVETANLKNEHSDIHNIYNLLWNRSIWDGYVSKQGQVDDLGRKNQRPLILTRSGAAGTQRYGAAMWSGDIGSNFESLGTHFNAQLHMSFSGIDYYGADVGGFRRESMPGNDDAGSYRGYEEELYTQWFANAAWFDVPLRPHTDNEFKKACPPYPTAPHLVGKRASNLANLRQRYELIPYYYSLAYRAFLEGEPLIAPLVVHYPADPAVRGIGHEKLIGRDILVAAIAAHGEYERKVYLPAGDWVDYHTGEWFHGALGFSVDNVPAYRDGVFRLPAFVRAGALLPQMFVDEKTLDAAGHRKAGAAAHTELVVQAYAGTGAFTLYEDDGESLSYDAASRPKYVYRTTPLRQNAVGPNVQRVEIGPASFVNGSAIAGMPSSRSNLVRLTVDGKEAVSVTLDGALLTQRPTLAALEAATSGWCNSGPNTIHVKSPSKPVAAAKVFDFTLQGASPRSSAGFVCTNGATQNGESVYVSGNIPALGNGDFAQAVKLSPDVYYEYIWAPPPPPPVPPSCNCGPPPPRPRAGPTQPVWTKVIDLPPATRFTWRCLRKQESGSGTPVSGAQQSFTTGASGYSGRAAGSL